MIEFRPILYVLGIFLVTLAIAMAVPISFDLRSGSDDWQAFLFAMAITGFFGILLVLTNRSDNDNLHFKPKQAFILTSFAWVILAAFAALPFCASSLELSFTDAYFETISGLTTTGATVIADVESLPPGLLIWRSLLVWMGGVGIIVMALSVLPMLRVGGMQLFRTEFSERDKHLPKIRQMANSIIWVYLSLTFICLLGYHMGGMNWFDALNHAMTTLGTGGFSTFNTSFMDNTSNFAQWNATFFMVLASLPFALLARFVAGSWASLLKDSQVRGFILFVTAAMFVMSAYLVIIRDEPLITAMRMGMFNVASVISTTGYANADYNLWGPFALVMFFFLTCVGGCAGSSAGGLKFYRFQILASVAINQMRSLVHPNGVFVPHFNNKPLQNSVTFSVLSFFFVFALSFTIVALALAATGLDFITAMSASVTTLANVGPGLGVHIGPMGSFQPLPDTAIWICSGAMLLGRLEMFTLLVLLMPSFWRR
ncbi:MAG TPA: TrkH family potassium uptake protein [Alphaproteobacteria bacterium]